MGGISNYFKLTVQYLQSIIYKRLLGGRVGALLVQTNHGLMAVAPSDRGVGRRLLIDGDYAAQELERLAALVSEHDDILVVGAHIGAIAVPLARKCRELVAVEPNAASRELLELNLRINDIQNCRVLPIAAADREGSLEMLMNTANSGGSKRIPVRNLGFYSYDNPARVHVPARRLDTELGARSFKLIVMDIEGSEYFALRGMQSILQQSSSLAVEFLPHHLRDVAGIDVATFLAPIEPHFSSLFIPSRQVTVSRDRFKATLEQMYADWSGDDGLIFSK
jgi:FkbM family methyltransferase